MAYIPTADDIQPEELAIIATRGDVTPIAERLNTTVERLQRLMRHDELMVELIQNAVAELETLSKVRLSMMIPQSLDTLELVMDGRIRGKETMSRVKAAETVLDRTLPKKGRDSQSNQVKGPGNLPSVADLLENAKSPEEALALMERQQELMKEIDDLRNDARKVEIIEVKPEVIEE